MATVEELQETMARMQAAMKEQQRELLELRQGSAKQAEAVTVQLALAAEERRNSAEERKGLAEIRKTLIEALTSRPSKGADDVVDGKSVGQPSRLAGRKGDFTNKFTNKFRAFLAAKLGQKVASLLKWAQQQRKVVVSSRDPGDREVTTHSVFRPGARDQEIADLENVENRVAMFE